MIKTNKYIRLITALLLFTFQKPSAESAETIAPPDAAELAAKSAVLMDASSGAYLFAKNPDMPVPPASLAKLMTIYAGQKLAALRGVSLDEPVPLPPESWAVNQPPRSSLMFLAQGQIVTLRELFLGLAIPSGNDAAVAVALRFAPSIAQFADVMNNEAARLGLKKTRFVEPSGIDENNITTAAEFARFCREYIKAYPENLPEYHTVPEFAYPQAHNLSGNLQKKPGTIKQVNHISILNSYPGADGLKTGYIDESGYNLAATALRDGTRYIAVILGVPAELGPRWGDRARTEDARKLFDYGFSNFRTLRVTLPPIRDAKIWKGRQNRLPVRPALLTDAGMAAAINNGAELSVTIPKERGDDVRIETTYIAGLCAPLAAGMKTGALVLSDSAGVLATISLLGQEDIQRAGAIKRFFHSLAMFFRGIKALPPVQNG